MSTLDRRRLLLLAPLAVAVVGGGAFALMLERMAEEKFDPHAVDAPIVGKPVPEFSLPGLGTERGFSSFDLRAEAHNAPVLLNFFASWCIPCASEADILGDLAKTVAVWGITYEDKPDAAAAFLERYGNPYRRLATDRSGRTAIDFGVYGVPESFLVGADGSIRWHLAGPLDEKSADRLRAALHAA